MTALGREGRISLLNLIEHHEIERRLRKIEDHPKRMLAVMLLQAKCYDERIRPRFEDAARRMTSKLTGDSEAMSLLVELTGGAHLGAYRFAERDVKVQRAKQAQIKKQANDLKERLLVADAVKCVTDRLGHRGHKLPVSDNFADGIRDLVLEELSRPKDAKKPSVRGIRNAISQNNRSLFLSDSLQTGRS
jgi:hypothetical protein